MASGLTLKKTAVVLFNLGGPGSQEEVRPFLYSLFSDPAILSLPNPLRSLLAALITWKRLKEAREIYALLGGGSPLLKNTHTQAQALEMELGEGYKTFVAMRHAAPKIQTTLQEVEAYDPQEVILLPLYPHYSTTTTESFLRGWSKAIKGQKTPTRFVSSYPEQSGFIEAMADLTVPHYTRAKNEGIPRVLFTAHGLPEKIIKGGDPYQRQIEQTAKRLVERLGLSSGEVVLCYQSRVGPLKWIGPSTEEEVIKAAQDKKPLVVVPISFVSEHSETLVELDITYQKLALFHGCPAYHRVETVQTHPSFIKGLASLVKGQAHSLLP